MKLVEQLRRGPYERSAECTLPGHYPELQALCDALGHAAQREIAEAIDRGHAQGRERAYGKWLGVRGFCAPPKRRPVHTLPAA